MEKEKTDLLTQIFQNWCGTRPQIIEFLPPSGSYRNYCRMQAESYSALGAWNADAKENEAFLSFSKSFSSEGLPVPTIYGINEAEGVYLLEDLGTDTLFDCLKDQPFNDTIKMLYRKSLKGLVNLQLKGKDCIDYTKCYPRAAFDRDSMMWDLNYFKYYFLKLVRIPFDEQALEDDFRTFADYLLQERSDYFLFRDFQSANIMIKEAEPYFIDYQGGRRGALQYDPASLLFDAKAKVPKEDRQELISYYMDELEKQIPVDRGQFMGYYQGYVLIRLMQAMGAFGFRGVVEKKPGFMESIPPALVMFEDMLEDWNLPLEIPELKASFQRMIDSAYLKQLLQTHL
ncbi:MAG: phosphotransferase [Bacteroidia bacterium]|nr:phosphotransferase [Bacteroidia bacterium]